MSKRHVAREKCLQIFIQRIWITNRFFKLWFPSKYILTVYYNLKNLFVIQIHWIKICTHFSATCLFDIFCCVSPCCSNSLTLFQWFKLKIYSMSCSPDAMIPSWPHLLCSSLQGSYHPRAVRLQIKCYEWLNVSTESSSRLYSQFSK